MRLGLLVAVVVLCFAAFAPPSTSLWASPPPKDPAKMETKVSPALGDFLHSIGEMSFAQGTDQKTSMAELSIDGLVEVDPDGRIQTYIYVADSGVGRVAELEGHDVLVEIVNHDLNIVQAWVPFNRVDSIAGLEFVRRIQPPAYAHLRTGSIATEGDQILGAATVRSQFGFLGTGIKVGVISDGADSLTEAQASGDLPGDVQIDPYRPGSGHEGTAMLEIVHDLAPGASLAFSGPNTSLEMIASINYLATAAFGGTGADIIVDDLGFFNEPFFEDGPVAHAVQAVVADGTLYVTSAGNYADRHYEGDFQRGIDDFHDFGGGDHRMRITIYPGGFVWVVLQWNDPFQASGNDYDLYVCPAGASSDDDQCATGLEWQNGDDNPLEFVFINNNSPVTLQYDVLVQEYSAAQSRRLELFVYGNVAVQEFVVPAGSVIGHAAVPGAMAVGAIDAADIGHDTIETFSSHGPSEVFFPAFESRQKPDVVAIDGVSVTGAGGFPSPFFGTSAAAPHVAGIAAQVLEVLRQEEPELSKAASATRVFEALRSTATDLGSTEFDNVFGAGRVNALAAVVETLSPPPPTPTPTPAPTPVPSLTTWSLVSTAALFALLFTSRIGRVARRRDEKAVRVA